MTDRLVHCEGLNLIQRETHHPLTLIRIDIDMTVHAVHSNYMHN